MTLETANEVAHKLREPYFQRMFTVFVSSLPYTPNEAIERKNRFTVKITPLNPECSPITFLLKLEVIAFVKGMSVVAHYLNPDPIRKEQHYEQIPEVDPTREAETDNPIQTDQENPRLGILGSSRCNATRQGS